MKTKLNIGLLFVAASLTFAGCTRTLEPGGVYNGDQILFEAESAINTSGKMLDTYVNWEKDNRDLLWKSNKGIKKSADFIRANAKQWFKSAEDLRNTYKNFPTPENASTLKKTLALINTATTEALAYYTKYALKKG